MRLLLDTNIIIDVLSSRPGYESSLQVLRCCEIHMAEGFVSAITVTDAMYIMRKHIEPAKVRETVQMLLSIAQVAGVLKSDIEHAFISDMADYEDAVQTACAKRIGADYIITRNIKDFTLSSVPAISPDDFLKKLG